MPEHPSPRRRRILLSTVSSDSHTWNLVFLQLFLEEHGSEVLNLGSCVPESLFLEAVRRYRPDAIVISSVNGHGYLDGVRLIRALREDPVGQDVPAMIGGKLGILGAENQQYADALISAGFDAVFTDSAAPDALTTYLAHLPDGSEEATPRAADITEGISRYDAKPPRRYR